MYFSIGTRCRITGAYDDAISYLRQSMSHFLASEDPAAQASVHLALSSVYRSRRELLPESVPDDVPAALSHASEALDWFYSAGDRTGEARALADLSNHYLALGELQTAKDYCSRALALNVEIGHMTGQVDALDTLGRIHAGLGDYDQAISYFLDALSTCSQAGIPVRPPHILESLGDAYLANGDAGAARDTWQELIDYARRQQRSEHPWQRHSRVLSKLERLMPGQQPDASAGDSSAVPPVASARQLASKREYLQQDLPVERRSRQAERGRDRDRLAGVQPVNQLGQARHRPCIAHATVRRQPGRGRVTGGEDDGMDAVTDQHVVRAQADLAAGWHGRKAQRRTAPEPAGNRACP